MKDTILVDMDGVLADYDLGFLNFWRMLYPEEVWVPREQRRSFYIDEDYPEELRNLAEAVPKLRGFYRHLPEMKGAANAMNELKKYFEVFICTAPHTEYRYCVPEKYAWIDDHFGREWTRKIILTKDKTLVRGRYLIDDKPEIKGSQIPVWEQILYDQPYNRAADKRRLTWQNWRGVLLD